MRKEINNIDIKEIKELYIMDNKDIEKFAETATLAYKNYPLFKYLTKNKIKHKVVKTIISSSIKAMKEEAIGLSTDVKNNGIAIFVPPNYEGSKALPFLLNGGIKLFFITSWGIFFRLAKYEKHAMDLKKKYTNHKCWYLYNVTVKPEYQHQGMGSKLLKPMFEYFDKIGQDCYLETHDEENVKLYEHYGFELVEISKIPKTEIVQYSMLRKNKKEKLNIRD